MQEGIVSSIREQGKAILVMMGVAIITVLAMIVLGYFRTIVQTLPDLGTGNISAGLTTNQTVTLTINLFISAFGIVGGFAAITVLVIVTKVIIGVVKGLKS